MAEISVADVLEAHDSISQVKADAGRVYWLRSVARQDGRTTVMTLIDDEPVDITPGASIRSRVMEYGGGAYDVADGLVAYCDDKESSVFVFDGSEHRQLTPSSKRYYYGGLHLDVAHQQLIAVREDHEAQPEAKTEIVALHLNSSNANGGTVLITGADFYAGPCVHGDELAWFQWDHPNMSWDTCSVWRAPLDQLENAQPVDASDGVSALHPLWSDAGELAWCSDRTGFWNWTVGKSSWNLAQDCCPPVWVLDAAPAALLDDGRLATAVFTDGTSEVHVWNPDTSTTDHPLPGTADVESIASVPGGFVAVAQWPDRPATIERVVADGKETLVDSSRDTDAVAPETIYADGPAGKVHAFFYPAGDNAPLIVMTHGGPTAAASAAYDLTRQFWVSRGVAVLDVNYSGSTGFGREYRNRLRGEWGVLDVADVVAAVKSVTARGLADPARVVITGGSAGGYTTLQALVTSDVFAAGMSRYGIADLRALATDTHKAESRYLDGLIGPYPQTEELWVQRSPISQLDSLSTPMLILQGTDDKVVPPNQAEMMADAVREQKLPVALVMFAGEGHGFRGLAARRQALESQLSFLQQVLGLPHSDDVPKLEIENL